MVPSFYLLFIITSCLIVMHVYGSIIVYDPYLLPNNINTNNKQKYGDDDDQAFVPSRAANLIFPSIEFIPSGSHSYDNTGHARTERYSFGRKHHWDTYFGRRR
ncbi:unnamed protein product [Rotaria sordida]|uniref:Uncharacterized protein n=1 Tax=Rotaria sordida TaxID=392033 RepID=A0A813MWZ1_9BILA|nr:unnamed protein product [Rotaria sordida]CAF0729751.1 unnamed protein product [Rotaria sordida]CAF0744044.1 unnamed protein product [Rotaria sordida]CAF0758233.1 unnamed protein product [Rotaria sordida]CAF0796580.1 unnamed protein product [Rotaria sordida]